MYTEIGFSKFGLGGGVGVGVEIGCYMLGCPVMLHDGGLPSRHVKLALFQFDGEASHVETWTVDRH